MMVPNSLLGSFENGHGIVDRGEEGKKQRRKEGRLPLHGGGRFQKRLAPIPLKEIYGETSRKHNSSLSHLIYRLCLGLR